jgi:hypothetical protein
MSNRQLIPGISWLTGVGSRHVFKHLCEKYALVYFGTVNQHTDEHEMVRGVTLSASHRDRHYSVGTVHGHDIIIVERTDTVTFPGKKPEEYTWLILQVDLKNVDMPHTFIDTGHHDEVFYDNLFAKFARLSHVDKGVFTDYDPGFVQHFRVYAPPDEADNVPRYLPPAAASELYGHYGHFDYEWYQDHLLVYSTGRPATNNLMEHMLRAGLWLADELNANGPKNTTVV